MISSTECSTLPSEASSSGPSAPDHGASETTGNGVTGQLTAPYSLKNTEIMSSFQSVKDGHDRMNQPGANGDGLSNTGTSNWRHNTSMGEIKVGGGQYVLTDLGSMSGLDGEEKLVPGAFVGSTSVGSLWPTQSQLESSYAYAIRRVDGQFTQLIRADELRTLDLSKIPATQGPEGLLALPPLLLPRPERYGGGTFTPHKASD